MKLLIIPLSVDDWQREIGSNSGWSATWQDVEIKPQNFSREATMNCRLKRQNMFQSL